MDSDHRSPVEIGQVRTPEGRSPGRKYLRSLGWGILFNAGAYVWTSEIGEVFAASTPARRLETRAWPSPCTTPPWIWPLRPIGFTTVPTSTCRAEPEVRIHLPPAQSHVRTGLVKGVEVMFVGVIRLVPVTTLKIEATGPATALIPFFFPLRPTLFLTVADIGLQ